MKVVIINKSDSTGGAAVVSKRLMEALREVGEDARMLVCEKLSDSPFVELAASSYQIKRKFLLERLKIFIANGFNRSTLFKIDTGEEGLKLWKHQLVKEADAILINWVNQGMLSLKGFRKILKLGKPVIWTMHDMWEMTGVCHHAGTCNHFEKECGDCPLLREKSSTNDLSYKVWDKKQTIYKDKSLTKRLTFVAVSNWLKGKAMDSSLLNDQNVEVIPNAFRCRVSNVEYRGPNVKKRVRILFGAARLDDPIKGLETLKETSRILKDKYPGESSGMEFAMFGNVKNPKSLEGFDLPVVELGVLNGEDEVKKAYESADILVSASSYETLPGTLVEAQAYGCIPVSFNQGGQADIVDNKITGYLANYSENIGDRAANLAKGILWAKDKVMEPQDYNALRQKMAESVLNKFSYRKVAEKYCSLIRRMLFI